MSANRARYLKHQFDERSKDMELRLITELVYSAAAEGKSSILFLAKHLEHTTKALEAEGYMVNAFSNVLEISW